MTTCTKRLDQCTGCGRKRADCRCRFKGSRFTGAICHYPLVDGECIYHPAETQMVEAVRYAIRAGVVTAWPNDIADATIRAIRRAGYVTAVQHFRGVAMAQCDYGETSIEDEPTAKGRAFVAAHEALAR